MKLTTDRMSLFLYKYSILPPLLGFALGIWLYEYIPANQVWLLILAMGALFGVLAIFFSSLRFLLLIPIGFLFAWGPNIDRGTGIENYLDTKVDIEGVLYRSPEQRQYGGRLFIETDTVIENGGMKPAGGKVMITTGEIIDGLASGDRVRVLDVELRELGGFLNPGGFDLTGFYGRQGIRASGFTEGEEYIISFGRDESSGPVLHYIDRVRMKFASYVNKNFEYPESALLNALTVGYRGAIPGELRTEFSRAGVAHVLAISGLHVGAVAVFFYFLLKFALTRSEYLLLRFQVPRITAGLTIVPVFLYTALAGFSTSAVRAFIMITLYLISVVIGRDENKINTLGAAALIILIWHPWALFELSFRLSFAAVFGILLVHRFYPFRFGTLSDKLHSLIKSTVAAGFITLPLVVNSFGILPLVSIPANVLLVPFVEFLVIPLGLLSLLAFVISPYLAEPFISVNTALLDVVVFGIGKLNELPYSYVLMPRLGPVSWSLFIAAGVSLLLLGTYRKLIYVFPVFLAGFLLSLLITFSGFTHRGDIQVNILDAGQKRSAVFITLPDRSNVLIDGGYKRYGRSGYTEKAVIAPYLLHRGVRTIDRLILTSTDKDHLRGVEYLLESFSVKSLFTNGNRLDGGVWEEVYERGVDWRNLMETERIELSHDYALEVIKPGPGFVIKDSSLPYPVALRLSGPEISLLTGEGIYVEEVQSSLLSHDAQGLNSGVLYMHIVRDNESLSAFLNAVSPEALVTGALKGMEQPELESTRAIIQTKESGTVTIEPVGGRLQIKTYTGD